MNARVMMVGSSGAMEFLAFPSILVVDVLRLGLSMTSTHGGRSVGGNTLWLVAALPLREMI